MVTGDGSVNAARLDGLAVFGAGGGELSSSSENSREEAQGIWREVQYDEHGGGEIRRQTTDELGQRLDAPRRGADRDDVVARHVSDHARMPPKATNML